MSGRTVFQGAGRIGPIGSRSAVEHAGLDIDLARVIAGYRNAADQRAVVGVDNGLVAIRVVSAGPTELACVRILRDGPARRAVQRNRGCPEGPRRRSGA